MIPMWHYYLRGFGIHNESRSQNVANFMLLLAYFVTYFLHKLAINQRKQIQKANLDGLQTENEMENEIEFKVENTVSSKKLGNF